MKRLRREGVGADGACVFTSLDDPASQREVLLLIVADRIPVGREIRAICEREQKANTREREDHRVRADMVDHKPERLSHDSRVANARSPLVSSPYR